MPPYAPTDHTGSSVPDNFDLRDYLRPIWARKWLVLLVVALVTAGTYLYYANEPKVYKSSTQLFLQNSSLDEVLTGGAELSDRALSNQVQLIQAGPVRTIANERAGGQLPGSYSAIAQEGSDFITIAASSNTAKGAAETANAAARAYISFRDEAARRKTEAAITTARTELASLGRGVADSAERIELRATIRELETALQLPTESAQQVNKAGVPAEASQPRPKRNAIFAFVVSLFLAALGAIALDRLDRRLTRLDEVESAYGLPLLGAIPRTAGVLAEDDSTAGVLSPVVTEAFRTLRTNLQLESVDRPLKTIAVLSAVPQEGKSSVARNLALAYAEAGQRATVIDADLRQPKLANYFHVPSRPGFTELVAGQRSLQDVVQHVPVEFSALGARISGEGGGNGSVEVVGDTEVVTLSVIPSGALPPNPANLLAAERTRLIIEEIADQEDVVILDSPPLLAVSDIVPLLSTLDGVILVSRLGRSTKDAARDVARVLARIQDARVLGVVANGVPRTDLPADYGYGYTTPAEPTRRLLR